MHKHTIPTVLAIFAMAASCQKENKGDKPTEKVASSAIASVQIESDCPDPKSAADQPPTSYKPAAAPVAEMEPPASPKPAKPSKEMPARRRVADDQLGQPASLVAQSCIQSTIQIVFSEQGPKPSKVSIKAIRLITPEGKKLATIKSRLPTQWNENTYSPWNEVLKANSDTTVSYKLTPPDWNAVTGALEGNSHSQMYILEVDIDVGGQLQTVRSSEFARIQHHALPT